MLRQTYRLMKRTRDLLSEAGGQVATLAEAQLPHFSAPSKDSPRLRGFVCCPPDVWQGDISRGHDMMTFALKTPVASMRALMSPAGLRDLDPSFHTFDWIRDLRAVGSNEARLAARAVITAWVDAAPQIHPAIGTPERTTRRLMRLIGCYAFYAPVFNDQERDALYLSVQDQVRHLKRQAKINPDLCTQFFCILGITATALATGDHGIGPHFKALQKIVDRLILNDGGPSTRCPDDLPEILRGLIDLRHVVENARLPLPAFIAHAIDRIVPALQFFRLGDGALASFHGGQTGTPAALAELLYHTGLQAGIPTTLPHTGFERLSDSHLIALIDVGRRGPGHHASTSAFELSLNGARVIVGCGQHAIDPTWQDLLAATSAHSTLTLDHQDNITGKDPYDVDIARSYDPQGETVTITHTGYLARNGFTHRRALTLHTEGQALSGQDTVVTSIPPLTPIDLTVRFHLHPDVTPGLTDGGASVTLTPKNGAPCLFQCGAGACTIEDSIYLASTGRPEKSKQIVMSVRVASAQKTIGWEIRALP